MINAQQAAQLLIARRLSGTQGERLPESCRPTNLEEALAIQAAVSHDWCEQQDDSIGAWKCGLPSAGKLVAAPIYTRSIDSVPPVALWPKGELARVEPELAFFFGVDLPARSEAYSPAEVDAAISRTHLALELINSRYSDPKSCSFPEMLADCLVNQGLFIGPMVDSQLAQTSSEFTLTARYNGETHQYHAQHPNGLPRAPLYWLVEFLRSRGQGIMAGQAVITGSFAGVLELPLGCEISLNYQGLGELLVSFNAKY